jgi:hypothetical protein
VALRPGWGAQVSGVGERTPPCWDPAGSCSWAKGGCKSLARLLPEEVVRGLGEEAGRAPASWEHPEVLNLSEQMRKHLSSAEEPVWEAMSPKCCKCNGHLQERQTITSAK